MGLAVFAGDEDKKTESEHELSDYSPTLRRKIVLLRGLSVPFLALPTVEVRRMEAFLTIHISRSSSTASVLPVSLPLRATILLAPNTIRPASSSVVVRGFDDRGSWKGVANA